MTQNNQIRIFDGATAVVTGGASGIGRGLAEELAKRGSAVVLADRQIELAEEVASNICASGGKARAVKVDVADFLAVDQLIQESAERAGRLDYIFNNAGIAIGGTTSHYGIEDWNQLIDVNLRGVINGVQAAYAIMQKQGFGHIINTASVAGILPAPGHVAYAATKYAVVGLSNSLRIEAAEMGIRVSVLCPGFVRTPILDGGGKYGKNLIDLSPEQHRHLLDMIEKFKPMPPNIFAQKALDSIAKNKAIIVIPLSWRLFCWIHRIFPAIGAFLTHRHFKEFQKMLGKGAP